MLLLIMLFSACRTAKIDIPEEEIGEIVAYDEDSDGYLASEDCDDSNSQISPNAIEICDGLDNDCDGEIDEGVQNTYYLDNDQDGFGNETQMIEACEPPEGYGLIGGDCDDDEMNVYPGAPEVCDGIDNDCDGFADDGNLQPWYRDADGDGFGDANELTEACEQPSGYVGIANDCDDSNPQINPNQSELCDGIDNDCDELIDEGVMNTYYVDIDGDGHGDPQSTQEACSQPEGFTTLADDCDDYDSEIYPGSIEYCDFVDNDCNGVVDDNAVDGGTFYADTDGDGFGAGTGIMECTQPTGYSAFDTDCDDTNASIHPDSPEYCNGIDDDCDNQIDNGISYLDYYTDSDGDGYGDPSVSTNDCVQPANMVTDNTDCNDGDANINPGEAEVCNTIDDNCDGQSDEGLSFVDYYADADGDGYGDASIVTNDCAQPANTVADNTDCNDGDATINPGATEVCNSIDDDCNGTVDDNASDAVDYYPDNDSDSFGAGTATTQCTQPTGYVADNTDCDDSNIDINPNANELCNSIDDDCDGAVDDGFPFTTYYADLDGDGYGDPSQSTSSCSQPGNTVTDNTDCDDSNATVNPAGAEVCNLVDDDCNGTIDDNASDAVDYYPDNDGDSFGAGTAITQCTQPSGYTTNNTDCDDSNGSVNPGEVEVCNSIDDDCNGYIDDNLSFVNYYADADGDGYGNASIVTIDCVQPANMVTDNTDCNDGDTTINPGATEVCNSIDDDCNGTIDDNASNAVDYYPDNDGDGFGTGAAITQCTQPSGYVADNTDCDDGNILINPSASELCNSIDDDCNSGIDDGLLFTMYYADVDGDGYGDPDAGSSECAQPANTVTDDTDCDDAESAINPSEAEVCNNLDDDCDGTVDNGFTVYTFYTDADGDGYGDANSPINACTQPANTVPDSSDCDDTNPAVNPGEAEICNTIDDNCDGNIDDGLILTTYYTDADGDGYGDASSPVDACTQPANTVPDSSDCDDTNPAVNPSEAEICNSIDDNCDGTIDVGAIDAITYYVDSDGDGYGDGAAIQDCTLPSGYSLDSDDCDDGDAAINPGASEACDGIDNNCDGTVDSNGACACNVDNYNGHSYLFCTTASSFYQAESYCQSQGNYELVTINNSSENSWVRNTAVSYNSSHWWWIGYHNQNATGGQEPSGGFEWVYGSSNYTNWDSGQPDNYNNEDCVHLYADGSWNDMGCWRDNWYGTYIYFVCESTN